eukprot:TRINITY_DN3973_c0_g14_i1.p2 TRINITY_DN3973_c0_g14~~TRINITY_DN3973_c0_g14_i1.p2  ORF type:complete len:203 (+),score=66.27 TRINITY_DN3973_c0_g14_i1:122-730(+)
MGITDRAIVHYHLLLAFVSPGCLIGSVARFSFRSRDGLRMHTPATGALVVIASTLVMLIVGAAVLKFRLDWAMAKYKEKAHKVMTKRGHQAFNLLSPVFFAVGVLLGAISTGDVGWAVADGCSLQALWFVLWGVWSIVTCLDKVVTAPGPAADARRHALDSNAGAARPAAERPPPRLAPSPHRPAPRAASNPLAAAATSAPP